LSPLSTHLLPDEPNRVASWLGEALGGPAFDTDRYGDRSNALLTGDPPLTEEQRSRWVSQLCLAGRLTGLATEPEFWSAFTSYLDWESRGSVPDAVTGIAPRPPTQRVRWDWGPMGAPRATDPGAEPTTGDQVPASPAPCEPVSFESHIKPLFREKDRKSMTFVFDLWNWDDVKAHASDILGRLGAGTMPCDGPWTASKTNLFERSVDEGMSA
jgi:hypothetical protein